jgi:hypothetical protein
MKLNQFLTTAAVAIASIVSANATNTFSDSDLLLGISTSTTSYVCDLGNISALLSLSSGQSITWTLSVSGISETLGSTDWADSGTSTVKWGIVAADIAGDRSVWATASTTATVLNLGYSKTSTATTSIGNTDNTYINADAASTDGASSNVLSAASELSSDAYSWISYTKNTASFTNLKSCVISLDSSDSSTLDLYYYDSSATAGTEATLLGTFTLSDDGTLTYTAVPEPSTYAMVGMGGLAMLRMFRRRRRSA